MSRFRKGQRVLLLADEEEGWPEERATVLGSDKKKTGEVVYMVEVDAEQRDEDDWDGLREVGPEQMEALP